MADVQVQCTACGNAFKVSEYADRAALVCAKCGAAIEAPAAETGPATTGGVPRLQLATPSAPPAPPAAEAPPTSTRSRTKRPMPREAIQRRQRRAARRAVHRPTFLSRINGSLWACWILFGLLALAAVYLRFFWPCTPATRTDLGYWGAIALLACHIAIIISAFMDETFHGVMCTIVPGYSLYYLMVLSDEYALRAVTFGLLAGFGLDAWVYLSAISAEFYKGINDWIQVGGDKTTTRVYGHH